MLQAVTQFTTLNRAPSAAPALRSHMVGRQGQAAAVQASTTRFAKKKDDDDEDGGGGGEKEAFSPTAVVMQIPYFGLFATAGAAAASQVIGAFAEQFETKHEGKK